MGAEPLGLIAGGGSLPLEVAAGARRAGRPVTAIAFHGQTDPGLDAAVRNVCWVHPGQVERAVGALLAAGVRDAVMAGKLSKAALIGHRERLRLDASAAALIRSLPDRLDDSILALVADHLESRGIALCGQLDFVPQLIAEPGVLGNAKPTADAEADVRFGWPIAKAIGGLDIGQTVVVKAGAVLAVEAIEGTDEAIRRAGALAAGACVVKVAKPDQDPRFDVPAIGPDTAAALVDARAATLAFEARQTVVLDREELVRIADAHGIALLGVEVDPLRGPIW